MTVVSSHFPPTVGGVADYTMAWCRAMRDVDDVTVSVVTSSPAEPFDDVAVDVVPAAWGLRHRGALEGAVAASKPDVILVQWAPYAYTRHGSGLALAMAIVDVARRTGVPLVVNAHELYLRWGDLGHRAAFSATQRAAIGYLVARSAAVVVTVRARRDALRRALFPYRRRVELVPVGATIPAQAPGPGWREERGVPDGTFLLGTFGLGHPSFDTAALVTALDALAGHGIDARLLVAGGIRVDHPRAVHLGHLDASELGRLLAGVDLLLLPLTDGASGRRTTLVSALAAGAALVSTEGGDTDGNLFPPSAITLTPARDERAFVAAVVDLASAETSTRTALRAGARALYEREFAWPVLVRRWTDVLAGAVQG